MIGAQVWHQLLLLRLTVASLRLTLVLAVLAVDLLGFGESSKPTGVDYDPHLWKDQIVSFVNQIVAEPVILVGNSIGSQVLLLDVLVLT